MIVWGGCVTGSLGNNACEINLGQGGRYDPASDSWTAAATAGEPSPLTRHRAVWTGDAMIVWGGYPGIGPANTGGRYDPAADSWTPTSTAGAPAPRSGHSAAWTGAEMIVWGGCDGSLCAGGTRFGDGARYLRRVSRPWTWPARPRARRPYRGVVRRRVIVWGGQGQDACRATSSSRYDRRSTSGRRPPTSTPSTALTTAQYGPATR
jgi:hypothetical protein